MALSVMPTFIVSPTSKGGGPPIGKVARPHSPLAEDVAAASKRPTENRNRVVFGLVSFRQATVRWAFIAHAIPARRDISHRA